MLHSAILFASVVGDASQISHGNALRAPTEPSIAGPLDMLWRRMIAICSLGTGCANPPNSPYRTDVESTDSGRGACPVRKRARIRLGLHHLDLDLFPGRVYP